MEKAAATRVKFNSSIMNLKSIRRNTMYRKTMIASITLLVAAIALSAAAFGAAQSCCVSMRQPGAASGAAAEATLQNDTQTATVEVTDKGFEPPSLKLKACAPILVASPRLSSAQQRGGDFAPAPPLKGVEDKPVAINTDLVSLRVSVTDKEGRFVSGLSQGAFAVYEDGVRQEISFFSEQDVPVAVGVVLDVSGSMNGGKIMRAREALRHFIQTSHEDDEYFLIGFNDRPQLLLEGARGNDAMLARISGIEPQGDTALYDAIAFGLEQVKRSRLNKRALIVISEARITTRGSTPETSSGCSGKPT